MKWPTSVPRASENRRICAKRAATGPASSVSACQTRLYPLLNYTMHNITSCAGRPIADTAIWNCCLDAAR